MNKFIKFISRRSTWSIPYVIFLLLFVVLPLILIGVYAFMDYSGNFTVANFVKFIEQPEAIKTFVYSVAIAIITTFLCILLGYPAAYILSNKEFNRSKTMVLLFILPMWVNILIRTLATVSLFDITGIPLGEGALLFGLTYDFLPFMIYPIYNTMMKIDKNLIEAAQDLGANQLRVFLKVILPLSMPGVVSGIIYGISLILLYTMSSIYHGFRPNMGKKVLQVLDHCTIYFLIAGTYTPVALCAIRPLFPVWGWLIFGFVWGVSAIAAVFTAIDLKKYAKLSMACYIGLGWCVVLALKPTIASVPTAGLLWLLAGGIAYTVGAVFYGLGHKRRYTHSVFHIFCLVGSGLHILCILFYVI